MIKSAISFGLVYIPVNLSLAIHKSDIGFNMIHKKTNSRIKYMKTCVDCEGKEVSNADIVKGYEYEDDKYVIFEEKDFERLKTKQDKTITIIQFADLKDVDPIYYEKTYYVSPNKADKAYGLLVNAMRKENKIAIARCVLGTKETLIALRVKDNSLIMTTLYFDEEVVANPTKAVDTLPKTSEELKLATSIIKNMTKPFDAKDYKDEYNEKLIKAIQTKIDGKEIRRAPSTTPPNVINLLDALKKSLATETTAPAKMRRIK